MSPHRRWGAVTLALAVTLAQTARAQERNLGGVRPLSVHVAVRSATLVGDTVTLAYAVENTRSGGEDFSALLVTMPAPVVRMIKPDRLQWVTSARYRSQAIAVWVLVEEEMLHPGQTSPDLVLSARGLPDLVRYWAVPDLEAHPPRYIDGDSDEDPYFIYGDTGTTVGLVSVPVDATPASLAARLHVLTGRACGALGWIGKPGICRSLDEKLANAEVAIAGGQSTAARNELAAFGNELDAQHGSQPGKAISDEAYALLALNAAYLRARL